jgi:putative transposon-encoded protein
MIVSPDPIPQSRGNGLGIATEKILDIQQEILLINKHKREHIADNGEIRQPDSSCAYCQRRQHLIEMRVDTKMTITQQEKNRKKVETLNEIERRVEVSGKNGCVIVPRTWQGRRVKIVLVDEN